jgi:hypothetical protein
VEVAELCLLACLYNNSSRYAVHVLTFIPGRSPISQSTSQRILMLELMIYLVLCCYILHLNPYCLQLFSKCKKRGKNLHNQYCRNSRMLKQIDPALLICGNSKNSANIHAIESSTSSMIKAIT